MFEEIIFKAKAATQKGNWSLANQYLQQLTVEKNLNVRQVKEALDIALEILEWGEFQERWDVAKIFPKFGEIALDPLIEIAGDKEAVLEHRWFAARLLGKFNSPEAIAALVDLLQTTDEEDLANIASSSLAELGKTSIDGLSNLLANSETRLLATKALAQIRSQEAIKPLLTVVKDDDIAVRSTAIEALTSVRDNRIPPILISALKDPASAVRKEAIIGLGLRTDLREELNLVALIKPLLYDFNWEVCQQAAFALSRQKTDVAAAALFEVLNSPATPPILQISLIHSLAWMESLASLSYLELSLSALSPESVLEIIRVFGRIKTANLKPKAAQILLNFFYSQNSLVETIPIQQGLANAWGQLQEKVAVDALMELKEKPEKRVSLQAIAALKNFT
ncbi:MAG: HEAT repeat domain-containing protein [Okeania sp. SIO2H7]|nr:HEAT repeat domain-containing protein [Okeania sp. SIO2H7]